MLLIPIIGFSQTNSNILKSDTIGKVKKEKIGYDFYLKTEFLNTLVRAVFVRPTYDVDIQAGFRLTNKLHLVGTYGKTTFDLTEEMESSLRPNVFMHIERTGTSFHRSSLMLRFYPFHDYHNGVDFLFVESGVHFQNYRGMTAGSVFDSTNLVYENKYEHQIEMYRFGPQLNIGMSLFFDEKADFEGYFKRRNLIFSPEFFIGIQYYALRINKDEFTNIIGTMPNEPYSEAKFHFTIRAKIGIGFH